MNHLFNPDNLVWRFLSKCVDIIILSILWFLFSVPVITLGASTAALYHAIHKSVYQDEGYAVRSFLHSFRENVKQGILLTLLSLFPFLFCVVAWLFADSLGEGHILGLIYRTASVTAGILAFSTAAYLFPLLSRFYMKTTDMIKTAFALAITRAGFTLLLDVILLFCIVAVYLIPAAIFTLPGAGALAAERLIEPAFQKFKTRL